MPQEEKVTHFGFESIEWEEKEKKVAEVFHAVASKYDFMNDLLSFKLHRVWKWFTIEVAQIRQGFRVLDLAGGSGDLTRLLSKKVGQQGEVVLADINASMLAVGRDRLIDEGIYTNLRFVQANAEMLPFAPNSFHCITMAFGLRNVTDKEAALRSIYNVCKPGGKIMVLEFSTPVLSGVQSLYDWYSFNIMPKLGGYFADDASSYRYLVESIRMHPCQEDLKAMIESAGFEDCRYHNLSGGIVALHVAYKY